MAACRSQQLAACMVLGRDLVRALRDVTKYLPLRDVYDMLATQPVPGAASTAKGAPATTRHRHGDAGAQADRARADGRAWGLTALALDLLLAMPTPRKFLQWRLTPLMEEQILFIMDKVRPSGQHLAYRPGR